MNKYSSLYLNSLKSNISNDKLAKSISVMPTLIGGLAGTGLGLGAAAMGAPQISPLVGAGGGGAAGTFIGLMDLPKKVNEQREELLAKQQNGTLEEKDKATLEYLLSIDGK